MARGYVYDPTWEKERERLRGMEALWDAGTAVQLDSLGVTEGWRCLEVGAGAGSVAELLADRVGESGHVVAADLDTRYLDPVERPNLEVLQHDVASDELPGGPYDLVHARLLIEHIPESGALERMIGALKPGGWLLAEDYDFASAVGYPQSDVADRIQAAIMRFMSEVGSFDPHYGRRLVQELRGAGLEEVSAEGRLRVMSGGAPGTDFYRFTLESLRAALVERGDTTEAEVDECLALFDDDQYTLLGPTLVAARGRRP